jgi:hypothetical protein
VQYGSAEAAQEAAEAHKDKTRKSELQTVRYILLTLQEIA